MRAHQIMTRPVISVTPDTKVVDAANTMLQKHISGLPVVDAAGKLVGLVTSETLGEMLLVGEAMPKGFRFGPWDRRHAA